MSYKIIFDRNHELKRVTKMYTKIFKIILHGKFQHFFANFQIFLKK